MSAKAAKTTTKVAGDAVAQQGPWFSAGWYLFLALVGLTPVVLGALPPFAGAIAMYRAGDPIGMPKLVAILGLSGLSAAALCVGVIRGESKLYWHPAMWILVGLLAWSTVSTVFAPSPVTSVLGSYYRFDGLAALLGYVLVAFLAIQYVRSTSSLRTLTIVAVVAGLLVSTYAVLQYLGVDPVWAAGTDRVTSTFGNPDMLGNYLVFPLALAAGLALSSAERRTAWKWWAAAALISAAMAVTFTRGAWIGALIGAVCLLFVGGIVVWTGSRNQKLAVGVVAGAVVAAIAAAIVLIRPRMATGPETFADTLQRISNGRSIIWATGLRAWLERPILGWGPDSFARAFDNAVGPDWYAIVQGFQSADNAHNFLIQRLVTIGVPGFVLTVWALVQTAVVSLRAMLPGGRSRVLAASLWAALVGLTSALLLGVSIPWVSVWLWLTVGLLLALSAREMPSVPKVALGVCAALSVAFALWAGSWFVADVFLGTGSQMPTGAAQVAAYQAAVAVNPLSATYRWREAEAMLNDALAQRASITPAAFDALMTQTLAAYDSAAQADRGDALVRVAYANILIAYGAQHPGSAQVQQAVDVATEAVRLAPRNPPALVALAKAYNLAGRHDDALATARLARSIAPEYSMQTLGSLGQEITTP